MAQSFTTTTQEVVFILINSPVLPKGPRQVQISAIMFITAKISRNTIPTPRIRRLLPKWVLLMKHQLNTRLARQRWRSIRVIKLLKVV